MNEALLDRDDVKIEVLRLVHEGSSQRDIEQRLGVSRSAVSKFINKKTYSDWWEANDKPIAAGDLYDHRADAKQLKGKTFIITSCQNNTYVHSKFLASLEQMAEHRGARIIVGTFSYNTNGFQNLENGDGEWFDPSIRPYILDEPAVIADGLLWCGELNILPTAVNPLSGFHSYTKNASGIIPHAKIQLESLPTHPTEPCRMLYTTGSVSKRNYIQKKAGQKASFHHVFGALVVEVDDDGDWFVRQLIADSDSGEFQDLDVRYHPNGWDEFQQVEAINWGDIHVEKLDRQVALASFFGRDSMLDVLSPNHQFIHDAIDFTARNHHNIKDPYFRYEMYCKSVESVQDNVRTVADLLRKITRHETKTVIIESNHDLAFRRWLKEADYKTDPANALYFLENQYEVYKQISQGNFKFQVFKFAVEKFFDYTPNMVFLTEDESFKVCNEDGNGIECGSHGHNGANGSRGGVAVYQKLGSRYNIGHSHSAAIKDGVYCAGVSAKLDMGYNKGASSWSHSHIVTYPNGKRSIVTIKNGKWRVNTALNDITTH